MLSDILICVQQRVLYTLQPTCNDASVCLLPRYRTIWPEARAYLQVAFKKIAMVQMSATA